MRLAFCHPWEEIVSPVGRGLSSTASIPDRLEESRGTRARHIPRIVGRGPSGGLADRGDDAPFADAILRMLESAGRWRSMAARRRKRAGRHFAWERADGALARIHEEWCEADAR